MVMVQKWCLFAATAFFSFACASNNTNPIEYVPLADTQAEDMNQPEGMYQPEELTETTTELTPEDLPCVPDCTNRECGYDGCGGTCGTCLDPSKCNLITGLCEKDEANCDGKECGSDGVGGSCGECSDTSICDEGLCKPAEACGYCAEPYPTCMLLDGVISCVDCQFDSDCDDGQVCDLEYYSCKKLVTEGSGLCDADNPCQVNSQIAFNLACDLESGLCYDSFGWCDEAFAMCRDGSSCVKAASVPNGLIGRGPDFYPPGANAGNVGLCSCSTPIPTEDVLDCVLASPGSDCPVSPECLGNQRCIPPASLQPLIGLPASTDGICVDLSKVVLM